MTFKDISYLMPWWPFCYIHRNHLCNLCRGHHLEQFREIDLKLDQWFRRRFCLKYFLSRALTALVFSGIYNLCNFGRGHYGEHSCDIILNLDQWFGRRCLLKVKFTDDGSGCLPSGGCTLQCTLL